MATTTETTGRTKIFLSVSYSNPQGDDHLLRKEVERVKDESTTDFVTVSDETVDVGEKDDWLDRLNDQKDTLETAKADSIDSFDNQIELVQDQIDEIEALL